LASGPSKACFRKGWKPKTASWPEGPTAAFYALQDSWPRDVGGL